VQARTPFRVPLWLTIAVLAVALGHGQAASSEKKPAANPLANAAAPKASAPEPPPPSDALGRSTPRGCVLGFLHAAENRDFAQAAKYLDSRKPEADTEELAMQLKSLLDLGTSSDLNQLSRAPEGDLNDNLRTSRERVGEVSTPAGSLEVFLDRVERPNEQPIWLFSQETLRQVPKFYASLSDKHQQARDLSAYFPEWMSRVTFLSIPLWRWIELLLGLGAVLLLAGLLTRVVLWLLRLALHGRMSATTKEAVLKLKGPIFVLMMALIDYIGSSYSKTVLGRNRWEQAAVVTSLVAGAWLLIRLADIFASYAHQRFILDMHIERATFVGLITRMLKILVVIILAIILLNRAGVNVSALVTGLGIGGVAIAFAAQKTLSDLFGGIAIVMRGAVRVGDFCVIAGRQGTVEEIGISSLRMRTQDRTVVTIPNAKVAEMDLENLTLRDGFWLHQVFTLRFDTPSSVVQRVLDGMVEILKAHRNIDPASARARLIHLTNSGPQVEVSAYYSKPDADWAAFLAEQEPIILEMMRLVEEEGTAMVAPMGMVQMQMQGTQTEKLVNQ
jgi:MscS family membrane protein